MHAPTWLQNNLFCSWVWLNLPTEPRSSPAPPWSVLHPHPHSSPPTRLGSSSAIQRASPLPARLHIWTFPSQASGGPTPNPPSLVPSEKNRRNQKSGAAPPWRRRQARTGPPQPRPHRRQWPLHHRPHLFWDPDWRRPPLPLADPASHGGGGGLPLDGWCGVCPTVASDADRQMVAAGGASSSPQAAAHGCCASSTPPRRRRVPHHADWPPGGDASSSSGALPRVDGGPDTSATYPTRAVCWLPIWPFWGRRQCWCAWGALGADRRVWFTAKLDSWIMMDYGFPVYRHLHRQDRIITWASAHSHFSPSTLRFVTPVGSFLD